MRQAKLWRLPRYPKFSERKNVAPLQLKVKTLAIKGIGNSSGASRYEFEKEISIEEAKRALSYL